MSNYLFDMMVRECIMHNPDMEGSHFYIPKGEDSCLVGIKPDGTKYLYDCSDKSIRNISYKEERLREDNTEDRWRYEFALYLQRLMRQKGLTQRELSELTGISEVTICKYVYGKSTPSGYSLDKIEQALGCEPGQIMNRIRIIP